VRAGLAVRPGESVIDATFGAGGHAALLAADLGGSGKLTAIDRDPAARTYFEQFEKRFSVNARLLRGDFGVVLPQLAANGVSADAGEAKIESGSEAIEAEGEAGSAEPHSAGKNDPAA